MKRKERRACPELEWPWCDVCIEHVRKVNRVKHECRPRQPKLPWHPSPELDAMLWEAR